MKACYNIKIKYFNFFQYVNVITNIQASDILYYILYFLNYRKSKINNNFGLIEKQYFNMFQYFIKMY